MKQTLLAAATIARVQPRPIATLTCRVRRHCRLSRTQVPSRRRSLPISTISAEARAMSAPPAPIATPTTPAFSASESLMPSPTTIGRKPLPISAPTWRSLSSGNACATSWRIPTCLATASATARRSPVSNSCRPRPSSRRSARASAASARTLSASSSQPRKRPSRAIPAIGPSCSGTSLASMPSCWNSSGRPRAASPAAVRATTPNPWRSRISLNG
ncbi:hypothetical protein PAERUG_P48_London_17_VIM_2_01_13_04235 [Pseudomonas aeruginosa]|nr:hypothetical protein PAERUG_P48_London_17_VIM_2_01_13_04235 [Pseudomonas aeruginosa]